MGSLVWLLMSPNVLLYACEVQTPSTPKSNVFSRHLVGSCTVEEREALAIPTDLLFDALQNGQSLDLLGVLIVGDLMFDQLPVQPLTKESLPVGQQVIKELGIEDGRIIVGSISIRESTIQGTWATNLRNDHLLVLGDIDITETDFQQSVDFSQTIFFNKVNFFHSSIASEGFFIRSQFLKKAYFDRMVFGTHSRFHKARFRENVSFVASQFQGVAEFLEVVFEKDAMFEQAAFQMGTGFSGAQFFGGSNFTRALFSREAYFRFTEFQQEAHFRNVTFQAVSDYSHAQFLGSTDFEDVEFGSPPTFTDSNIEEKWRKEHTNYTLVDKLAVGIASLGLLCFLVLGLKKLTGS